MKKVFKWIALGLALALVGFLLYFYNGMAGNPVSAFLAQRSGKAYLEEHFPDTDYLIERTNYNFKNGFYHVYIQSPSSPDSAFILFSDWLGQIQMDNYDYRVQRRGNTAERLDAQYREAVKAVLDDPQFPYESDIGYGSLEFSWGEAEQAPGRLIPETLELDREYDINELGAQAGILVLYIYQEELTAQRAAEVILEVKQQMDEAGVAFRTMDFTLRTPKDEETPGSWDSLNLLNLQYADIGGEHFLETVEENIAATKAYYDRMDAEKQVELP